MKKVIMLGMLVASSSVFAFGSHGGSVTFAGASTGASVTINGSGHVDGSATTTSSADVVKNDNWGLAPTANASSTTIVDAHAHGKNSVASFGGAGLSGSAGTAGNATGLWSNTFIKGFVNPDPVPAP